MDKVKQVRKTFIKTFKFYCLKCRTNKKLDFVRSLANNKSPVLPTLTSLDRLLRSQYSHTASQTQLVQRLFVQEAHVTYQNKFQDSSSFLNGQGKSLKPVQQEVILKLCGLPNESLRVYFFPFCAIFNFNLFFFSGKTIVQVGDIHPCVFFIHEGEVERWHTDEM